MLITTYVWQEKSGAVTEIDYANFADEISKWVESEEMNDKEGLKREAGGGETKSIPTPPTEPKKPPKFQKSIDVDW